MSEGKQYCAETNGNIQMGTGAGLHRCLREKAITSTACIKPTFQRQPGPVQSLAAVYDWSIVFVPI